MPRSETAANSIRQKLFSDKQDALNESWSLVVLYIYIFFFKCAITLTRRIILVSFKDNRGKRIACKSARTSLNGKDLVKGDPRQRANIK